jgi:UDP:flavonoid glycosyltransferase YjiC (YdhE family)
VPCSMDCIFCACLAESVSEVQVERLILNHSPTVTLAARIANLPCVLIGNGFELPPATDPLPPFPGFSWATEDRATGAERCAVASANAVLGAFRATPLVAVRDLMSQNRRLFATLPELDHYGERQGAEYIGPLFGRLRAPKVDWPQGSGPKIFASLRADTSHVSQVLDALTALDARVVCVVGGFQSQQLRPYTRNHVRFCDRPVQLDTLLDADLCVTYGAEGTMMTFLAAGVPQVLVPWHVEAHMAARRVSANGFGIQYRPECGRSFSELVEDVLGHARRPLQLLSGKAAGLIGRQEQVIGDICGAKSWDSVRA